MPPNVLCASSRWVGKTSCLQDRMPEENGRQRSIAYSAQPSSTDWIRKPTCGRY